MQVWTLSLPYTVEAERFHYTHNAFSVRAGETTKQGHTRSAREYAQAEKWAQDNGLTFEWSDDWEIGSHMREYDTYEREPDTCETCCARDANGTVVASLGCIDDATGEYRRVIEAKLADEVLTRQRATVALLASTPELRTLVAYAEALN